MNIGEHVERFSGMLQPKSKVLDVGCGLRPYESLFKNKNYIGIDVESSGRDSTCKAPDRYFDGVSIPYPDKEFDAILCTQVLEHCLDVDSLMREFKRVLKHDGLILLTVPFMWGEHEVPYDFRRFTSFGVTKLFGERGFDVVEFHRSNAGVSGISTLIESEKSFYLREKGPLVWWKSMIYNLEKIVWRLLLLVWKRIYRFDRIYLDNVVIARVKQQGE